MLSYKMPRKPINYQTSVMYKIVCDVLTVKYCYVGHTTDFTKRKYTHKTSCTNVKDKLYNLKLYTTIRANGGWDNWTMVLIEKYPCENKQQALQRERFWYEELNADLNMVRPYMTEEEIKQRIKDYQKNNQEKLKEHAKTRYGNNKEEIIKKLRVYSYKTISSIIDDALEKGYIKYIVQNQDEKERKKIKRFRPTSALVSNYLNWTMQHVRNLNKALKNIA